jgi:hypothetical protein
MSDIQFPNPVAVPPGNLPSSSGTQRPVSLFAAIRGPVLLIVLGSLFALDYVAGVSITRTWPVILIVAGLFRLFEYLGGKS